MATDQAQSNLRYELKINDMILMPAVKYVLKQQKQTLIDCIATMLGLESSKLHEIICLHLNKCVQQFTLPRKLFYIHKDHTIIQDYKKYPQLVNFMKITLQMVSQIFQIKITLFYLNNQGLLTGLIINEKGYQSQIKLARITNYYYQIKQSLNSNSHHSSVKKDPSSSSQSYKFYQAFDIQPLSKKGQIKNLDTLLIKSYSYIPTSPLLKKNASMFQQRLSNFSIPQPEINKPIQVPIMSPTPIKQFDQLSLQNIPDDQQIYSPKLLVQSIKFNPHQQTNLTQSLNIQANTIQSPQVQPLQTQIQAEEVPIISIQDQQPQAENNMYYGYYSQHINPHMYYHPSYMMGTAASRTDNYNNNYNISATSVSPGKISQRKQNNTVEISQTQRYTGRLKFFDQGKNYGFIIIDIDESDIFVHCDDLQKAGISKQRVRSYKQSEGVIRFSFKVMSYFGKYRQSRKAVDLIILDDGLGMPSLYT